jgi:hypothetical protein
MDRLLFLKIYYKPPLSLKRDRDPGALPGTLPEREHYKKCVD